MTQPPSPSAAALAIVCRLKGMEPMTADDIRYWLGVPEQKALIGGAQEIDAFAAQAVAAERAKPDFVAALRAEIEQMDQLERLCLLDSVGNTVYVNINYVGDGGEYDALDEGAKAKSEREKPAASDYEEADTIIAAWLPAGDLHALAERHPCALNALQRSVAAALAERGRVEREACAQWHADQAFEARCKAERLRAEGHLGDNKWIQRAELHEHFAAAIRNQTLTGD